MPGAGQVQERVQAESFQRSFLPAALWTWGLIHLLTYLSPVCVLWGGCSAGHSGPCTLESELFDIPAPYSQPILLLLLFKAQSHFLQKAPPDQHFHPAI